MKMSFCVWRVCDNFIFKILMFFIVEGVCGDLSRFFIKNSGDLRVFKDFCGEV